MSRHAIMIVLVISLISQGCVLEDSSMTPTGSEQPPIQDGTIGIISDTSFFDSYSGYHITGEIINNLATPVRNVQLSVAITGNSGISLLKDSLGNIVDQQIIFPSFTTLDVGEKSPFDFYFDTSNGIPSNYQIEISSFEATTIQRGVWKEENVQILNNGEGFYLLTGELVNLSLNWIRVTNLVGGVRDDSGSVLSIGSIGTHLSALAPTGDLSGRDRTPFLFKIPIPAGAVTQWDLWCESELQTEVTGFPISIFAENIYLDEFNSIHLVGTIKNDSDLEVSSPIIASLFGSDSSVLDVSYLLPVVSIPAKKSVPFEITNFVNYSWNKETFGLVSSYRVQIDPEKTETGLKTVELLAQGENVDRTGTTWSIKGSFTNDSSYDLSRVTALVSIISPDGELEALGYAFAFPTGDVFLQGDVGSYEVVVYLPNGITTEGLSIKTLLLGDIDG